MLERIRSAGVMRIGTAGDYSPMSCYNEATGEYEGFDHALCDILCGVMKVRAEYVRTDWRTLEADMLGGKFDIAVGGITRTFERAMILDMSRGYLSFGKTVLCRADDAKRFMTLEDIDRPDVTVITNPGGTNEKFVNENVLKCNHITHDSNVEIPGLLASGTADLMITDTFEAAHYAAIDNRLAAPCIDRPFTKSRFGIMMRKGDQDFLNFINFFLDELDMDGTLSRLKRQYVY